MKKALLFCLAMLGTSTIFASGITVNVTAVAHQYTGIKGMQVYTSAQHDIEIINDTDNNETFSYSYNYCGDTIRDCVQVSNNATVRAHKRWNNHHDSYLSNIYRYDGNFNLVATTSVQGRVSKKYDGYGTVIVR